MSSGGKGIVANDSSSALESEKMGIPLGECSPLNSEEEDDTTLTDHLNKRLLQSFLQRMNLGTAVIPPMRNSSRDDDDGSQGFDVYKEEKTLTDHLNKKLLLNFLKRMDAGTAAVPPLRDSSQDEDEGTPDFNTVNEETLDFDTEKVERTLTDHLNKKLLQSFLERMDAGTAAVPPFRNYSRNDEDEEKEDFDDEKVGKMLTDHHLNKRLLQMFLERMDTGTVAVPFLRDSSQDEDGEKQDY